MLFILIKINTMIITWLFAKQTYFSDQSPFEVNDNCQLWKSYRDNSAMIGYKPCKQ